jgi:hypothetical protein
MDIERHADPEAAYSALAPRDPVRWRPEGWRCFRWTLWTAFVAACLAIAPRSACPTCGWRHWSPK